jgi:8-oxo-dGTP pyrophosphatase MutT (NUDIX family)
MPKCNKTATEAYHNEATVMSQGRRQRHRVEVIAIGPDNTILATPIEINGYIELPGGGVDQNETLEQAAIRETEEEAGWRIANPRVLEVRGEWGYIAGDHSWLKENGYDEEVNFVVVCDAVAFSPKENFKSEGDGRTHHLLSLAQVIKETKQGMISCPEERVILLGNLRLAALKQLFNPSVGIESKPLSLKW